MTRRLCLPSVACRKAMFTCACDSHGGVFTATLSESRDTVTQFPCPTRRMADTANGKTATYHDGEVWVFFVRLTTRIGSTVGTIGATNSFPTFLGALQTTSRDLSKFSLQGIFNWGTNWPRLFLNFWMPTWTMRMCTLWTPNFITCNQGHIEVTEVAIVDV